MYTTTPLGGRANAVHSAITDVERVVSERLEAAWRADPTTIRLVRWLAFEGPEHERIRTTAATRYVVVPRRPRGSSVCCAYSLAT